MLASTPSIPSLLGNGFAIFTRATAPCWASLTWALDFRSSVRPCFVDETLREYLQFRIGVGLARSP